jgi:23S rRNA (guanosine2251-2'-O)-methyltransferase
MRRGKLLLLGMEQINREKLLTIYGRNSVKEALESRDISILKLHLSKTNRKTPSLDKILKLAKSRGVKIKFYDSRRELSFISKNSKQDQGVALDIYMDNFLSVDEFIKNYSGGYRVIALDGISNPQNLGMIIRSTTAGYIDAIVISISKSSTKISPLAIKASVGTVFKIPIIKSRDLVETLKIFKNYGAKLYSLSSRAEKSYKSENYPKKSIFILGNETNGVSRAVEKISDGSISIPMNRGVESLNVAVTASLISFLARD